MKRATEKQVNVYLSKLPHDSIFQCFTEKRERGYIERFYLEGKLVLVLDVATAFPKCRAQIAE